MQAVEQRDPVADLVAVEADDAPLHTVTVGNNSAGATRSSMATWRVPPPAIDVDAARAVTPGCHEGAFLASAGSSLPTRLTLDAVVGHLQLEAEIGGYGAFDRVTGVLEDGSRRSGGTGRWGRRRSGSRAERQRRLGQVVVGLGRRRQRASGRPSS